MDLEDRVRDALPVNEPYDDLVAQAYDTWLPHDAEYGDADYYRSAIERGGGPALELGCGNGRLLRDGGSRRGQRDRGCQGNRLKTMNAHVYPSTHH